MKENIRQLGRLGVLFEYARTIACMDFCEDKNNSLILFKERFIYNLLPRTPLICNYKRQDIKLSNYLQTKTFFLESYFDSKGIVFLIPEPISNL